MTDLSRRGFMGSLLGISGAAMFPGMIFPASQPGAKASISPSNGTPALARIKEFIKKWELDGQAFKNDHLEYNNDLQWDKLRKHYFDIDKMTCTSINSSNLCPSLKPVDELVTLVQQMLDEDISFPMRLELAQATYEEGLGVIKHWVGLNRSQGDPQCLLSLIRNTTEGNNIINNDLVVSGFFDPQKNNVVVWDLNHPTNCDTWYYRKATQGWPDSSIKKMQTKMFSQKVTESERKMGMMPSDPQNEDDIIIPLKNLIDRQTKMVTLSWQSNECGMLMPMKRIVHEIKSINKNIYIHADSAQAFGALDLKLDEINLDSISGSFHKWPCGPKLVGLLYMNIQTDAARKFIPNIWGYDGFIKDPLDYHFDPEKGEIDPNCKRFSYLGQQNDATLVSTWIDALFHTGKLHPNVTPAKIEARIRYLGDTAKQALFNNLPKIFPAFTAKTAFKWITTPTTRDEFRSSVFLFKVPDGIVAGDVMKNVYENYHFAIANMDVLGHSLLRISPTINNSTNNVNDVVEAIIDVILAMQKSKLPNNTHLRSYS